MSGSRLKLGPLTAVMGTPLEEEQAAKPRSNRLSRSSRQRLGSEQDSPRSQRAGEQHLSVPLVSVYLLEAVFCDRTTALLFGQRDTPNYMQISADLRFSETFH